MSLQQLKKAIEARKPISFTYNKLGKTPGIRIGNPHAVWVMRKKDGTESTKVHVLQTEGISDSNEKLPSFRLFDLGEMRDVVVHEDQPQFEADSAYNPEWNGYTFVVAKI